MSIDGEFEDEPMVDGEAARRRTDPPAARHLHRPAAATAAAGAWGGRAPANPGDINDRQYELVERVRAYDPQADETS